MDRANPDVVDPTTGRRQVASYYYPLIGPYDSADPDVLEYHVLLMKVSGIDGILVDWYGTAPAGGEARWLLSDAEAAIDQATAAGLGFGIVLEERFARSLIDARQDVAYVAERYLTRPGYLRIAGTPALLVFGPAKFTGPGQWREIIAGAGQNLSLYTLWDNDAAGPVATGHFAWPYDRDGDYFMRLASYYRSRRSSGATVIGAVYPGFEAFYREGQDAGPQYFDIPPDGGRTLDRLFCLAGEYSEALSLVQLSTWNDFGEGTMFEPTVETGLTYLQRVQAFTGVPFGREDLRLVHRLYELRKRFAGVRSVQVRLSAAAQAVADLRLADARAALASITGPSD